MLSFKDRGLLMAFDRFKRKTEEILRSIKDLSPSTKKPEDAKALNGLREINSNLIQLRDNLAEYKQSLVYIEGMVGKDGKGVSLIPLEKAYKNYSEIYNRLSNKFLEQNRSSIQIQIINLLKDSRFFFVKYAPDIGRSDLVPKPIPGGWSPGPSDLFAKQYDAPPDTKKIMSGLGKSLADFKAAEMRRVEEEKKLIKAENIGNLKKECEAINKKLKVDWCNISNLQGKEFHQLLEYLSQKYQTEVQQIQTKIDLGMTKPEYEEKIKELKSNLDAMDEYLNFCSNIVEWAVQHKNLNSQNWIFDSFVQLTQQDLQIAFPALLEKIQSYLQKNPNEELQQIIGDTLKPKASDENNDEKVLTVRPSQ